MFARELRVSMGSKLGAVVLGTALLVVVGVFLAFGFVLLLGLAAAGLLLGIGAALFRRLTGQAPAPRGQVRSHNGLDPALEVKAPPAPRERQERVGGGEPPH